MDRLKYLLVIFFSCFYLNAVDFSGYAPPERTLTKEYIREIEKRLIDGTSKDFIQDTHTICCYLTNAQKYSLKQISDLFTTEGLRIDPKEIGHLLIKNNSLYSYAVAVNIKSHYRSTGKSVILDTFEEQARGYLRILTKTTTTVIQNFPYMLQNLVNEDAEQIKRPLIKKGEIREKKTQ